MKKLMAIAIVLSGVAAAAVWFGLPVYAENQFRQSLDTWAASRPDGKAGYSDASFDYWAGRVTIGSLTEVIEAELGGAPVQLLVTMNGIVIEDYDYAAANRAATGKVQSGDRIASLIAWDSIAFVNDGGTLKGNGGAGQFSAFAATRVDPLKPLNARGLSFETYEQAPVDITFSDGPYALTATIGALRVSGYDREGIAEIAIGKTEAKLVGGDDQSVEIAWDTYRIEGARMDESIVDLYADLFQMLASMDDRPQPEEIARIAEETLRFYELAEEQKLGFRKVAMDNLVFEMAGVQSIRIGRVEGSDIEGLKIGSIVSTDTHQTDVLGNVSTIERNEIRDVDMSALPAYARKVLGAPITVGSLDAARDFYASNTIAAAIPAIDLGVWEYVGQTIRTPDGQDITFDRMALDSWKATENGNIILAFSVEGMSMNIDAIPADPNAQMALTVLKSQGIETLKINMNFSVEFSPTDGELTVNQTALSVDQLAALEITGKVGGLDVEKIRNMPPEARSTAVMSMSVETLKVSLNDRGGRDVAFTLLGAQSGASPQDMAFALSLQAQQMIGNLGSARAEAIGEAAAAFVQSGGTLVLEASAEQPAPIIQLILKAQTEGPAAVLDLLQVEASHQPPQ